MSRKFETIFYGDVINCVKDENGKEYNLQEMITLLNEQSDTIEGLILDRNRQEEKLDIARRNLSKQLEKIEELAEENEQLRQEIERLQKIIDLTSYQLKVQDRILKEVGE